MKTTEMVYLVCYDVSDNRCRSRLAKKLEIYGLRIQMSVFECVLTQIQCDRIVEFINKTIDGETDRVRLYPLTEAVRAKVIILGLTPEIAIDDDVFIL